MEKISENKSIDKHSEIYISHIKVISNQILNLIVLSKIVLISYFDEPGDTDKSFVKSLFLNSPYGFVKY